MTSTADNIFCREIHITLGQGRSIGELVDDFHHFRATIEHDGTKVLSAEGEALRVPWATCPGAIDVIHRLEGALLAPSIREVARFAEAKLQCTHLYDAACLAVARTARGAGSVVYRIEVPDRRAEQTRATLKRDNDLVFAWQLDGLVITDPAPFTGRLLAGGNFATWAEETLDREQAEAALVLQRACMIAGGREFALDDQPRAIDVPHTRLGVCHTYSKEQGELSFRVVGSARRLNGSEDVRSSSLKPAADEIRLFHRS